MSRCWPQTTHAPTRRRGDPVTEAELEAIAQRIALLETDVAALRDQLASLG